MNPILLFGFSVCMILAEWGGNESLTCDDTHHDGYHDASWMFNANDNAMAFDSKFGVDERVDCPQNSLCNGEPAHCSLVIRFYREGEVCYENFEIDIPVARVDCTNMFNCSWYGPWDWWGPNPDPNDCCQIIGLT